MGTVMVLKRDVHPEVIARAFKVHLRTVFRWIEKDFLPSANGRVERAVVLEALSLWSKTYSRPETRRILKISAATVTSWKKREILKSVEVLGTERIYKNGVECILNLSFYRPGRKILFSLTPQATARRAELEAQRKRGKKRRAAARRRRKLDALLKAEREAHRENTQRDRDALKDRRILETEARKENTRRDQEKQRRVRASERAIELAAQQKRNELRRAKTEENGRLKALKAELRALRPKPQPKNDVIRIRKPEPLAHYTNRHDGHAGNGTKRRLPNQIPPKPKIVPELSWPA